MRSTLAALTAFLVAPSVVAAPLPDNRVRYEVSPVVEKSGLTALAVRIDFRADADGETRLILPKEWAGSEKLERLVRNLRVDGGAVTEDGPAERIIRSRPRAHLSVRYQVVGAYDGPTPAQSLNFSQPIITRDGVYVVGHTIFARPEGDARRPASFRWTHAPEWLGMVSDLEHPTPVMTMDDIGQSVILADRDLRVFETLDRGHPVRVAIAGKHAVTDIEFNALVLKVIDGVRTFWRGKGEPFLVTLGPLEPEAGVTSLRGSGLDGSFGVIGTPNLDISQLQVMLTHEYFHSWNSPRLGGLSDDSQEPGQYWLSEGFTDYYARRIALRAGIINLSEFVNQWNEALVEYSGSPARGATNQVIVERFWQDDAVRRLPYNRGALIAALWASRTDLDALMLRWEARAATVTKAQYPSLAALFPEVARDAGLDVGDDITRYVDRGEIVVLPEDAFGGCITVHDRVRPVRDLGFDGDASERSGRFIGVVPDGAAHRAGLRDGMVYDLTDSGSPADSRVEVGYRIAETDGMTRTVRYRPEGRDFVSFQELGVIPGLDAAALAACAKVVAGG